MGSLGTPKRVRLMEIRINAVRVCTHVKMLGSLKLMDVILLCSWASGGKPT